MEWIKDLNLSTKTIKLLEENIGVNLRTGSDFMDMTAIGQTTKEKQKNQTSSKLNFCISNDTIK